MANFRAIGTFLVASIVSLPFVVNAESCPARQPAKGEYYSLNVRGNNSRVKSEFHCDFIWTDSENLKDTLLDRIQRRQKSFMRFTVPVHGYSNHDLHMENYSGLLTWVWVFDSHEYMLFYPLNFETISSKAMGIITLNWAFEYINGTMNPTTADLNEIEQYITVGYCDPECNYTSSCGIGKYELESFFKNVTKGKGEKFKWNYLCLQVPYNVNNVTVEFNKAFPDLLYYWYFLKDFFYRRPYFGMMNTKTDFVQYYCYDVKDNCEVKELLKHYWVVTLIGLLIWLYSPLLIYYFPSSKPQERDDVPPNMFPSYKTPIFFGRCLKSVLCFYMRKDLPKAQLFIRTRRLIFLIILATTSFRSFLLPQYYYYSWALLTTAVLVILWPSYLSEHILIDTPSSFLFWELPNGLIKSKKKLIEFQQLAHVLEERLYLMTDPRFWTFIFTHSYDRFLNGRIVYGYRFLTPLLLVSTVIFVFAIIWSCLMYFIPLPYFYVSLVYAIIKSEYHYVKIRVSNRSWPYIVFHVLLTICHCLVMIVSVFYVFLATFVWCHALSEIAVFTFIGGVLVPFAFQYFLLIGSIVAALYGLVKTLHEGYDRILKEIIEILKTKELLEKLDHDVYQKRGDSDISIKKKINVSQDSRSVDLGYCIIICKKAANLPESTIKLLMDDKMITYIDKNLFDEMVEKCKPLRRQILFLILKVLMILFYIIIALWVKNVYHLEDKNAGIFQAVNAVAVFFFPSLLQFVSYKNNFGKKTEILLKQQIYNALVIHVSEREFN